MFAAIYELLHDHQCIGSLSPHSCSLSLVSGLEISLPGAPRAGPQITFLTLRLRISPHLFRTCAASMAYLYAGDQPHLASALLQHTHRTVTEAHYNRAKRASFGRAFALLVER